MGPYCDYCQRRCFLLRVLKSGKTMLLATCARGMAHDLAACGETHETAVNPVTDPDTARALAVAARRICRGCQLTIIETYGTWTVVGTDTSADGLSYCPPDPDARPRGVHRPTEQAPATTS